MALAKTQHDSSKGARISSRLAYYFPTISIAVGVIVIWELLVLVFDIQQFLLPKPSAIFAEFMHQVDLWLAPDERSILFESSGATFWEAFGGFVIGCSGGVLVALITSRWTIISEATIALRHRGQFRADHRFRADHEQLVRHHQPGVQNGDRGDHRLLSHHD